MPNSSSSSTSPQLSNNREQTPIGTKFALTMLGINNPNSNSVSNSSNSAILFPKNTSQLQQRANSDTSVSSNESSVSNLQLYDESNEYKPIIKPESSIYDHNPLSPTSHTAKLLKKQTEENGDSLSPVAFSFSKTISLNESNIKLEAEQNEQINIKKQKLFDSATAAASRKNNVLLKKLLSTSTTKSPTDTSASSSSLFNVNTSPLLSTVNRQCSDFQAEFDLSPILVEPSQNLEEEDVDGKNEINFSSPIMSPSGLDHEQELKNTLYSSLTNKNKPEKQSMKLNPSQFSKQSSSSVPSSAKEDIILRTLLNTADLEPQILKLESVFDLNASFNSQKLNCAIKKEPFESQNQPPNQQQAMKTLGTKKNLQNSSQQQQQQQITAYNDNNSDQFSQQLTANEKTRKRKKIAKPGELNKQSQVALTAKQTSKKLAQTARATKQQQFNVDYDYQQQSYTNNNTMMIKQEKANPTNKKQTSKSLKGNVLNNKSMLKQMLAESEDDKKLISNDELLQNFKVEQPTSPLTLSMSHSSSILNIHHQQQQQLNIHHYSPYPVQQQQQQHQQQQHHFSSENNTNNGLLIKMNNIKEEKIFTSSSLSSSTTSVSSISSLSSPISHSNNNNNCNATATNNNNLLAINSNQNQNNSLVNSLLISNGEMCPGVSVDSLQHQQPNNQAQNSSSNDFYLNNQQQHMFLNMTNDLLDDFHLTSKTVNLTETENNSQFISNTVDGQFFMDTSNASLTNRNTNNIFPHING